jgi:hypothetical protein
MECRLLECNPDNCRIIRSAWLDVEFKSSKDVHRCIASILNPRHKSYRAREPSEWGRLPEKVLRMLAMSDIPYPDTTQPDIPVPSQPDLPTPVPETEPGDTPDLPPEPSEPPGDDVPKVG